MTYAFYVLLGNRWLACLLAGSTVVFWWFVSDYYVLYRWGGWRPWMDLYGFMFFSLAALIGLTAVCKLLIRRSGIRPANRAFVTQPLPVDVWRNMLQIAANQRIGRVAKHFLRWQVSRLARLSTSEPVAANHVFSAWYRGRRSALAVWLPSCWLLASWAGLALIPLHSNVTERVASVLSGSPQRIFAVECIGRDPETRKPLDELLQPTPAGFVRAGRCTLLSSGSFVVSSTAFPRVYRHLAISCGAWCSVAKNATQAPVLDLVRDIRSGTASFDWIQTNPEPRLRMTLTLLRQDGQILSTAMIEP